MNQLDTILADFDVAVGKYRSFDSKMIHLIIDLLETKQIKVHNISSRIKERESLKKKLTVKDKYNSLGDVTDIVGVRIITYFEDEVDIIAKIMAEEFTIDAPNSVDKRIMDYDRFGYSSLHYIASLHKSRTELLEYRGYIDMKFEIQIRSLLQHTWAEIEHDIGYKSKSSIPDVVKRNFSRVAALLETSDLEFTKLRNRLLQYETEVNLEIEKDPQNVDLNNISLQSFYVQNNLIADIDSALAKAVRGRIDNFQVEVDIDDIPKLQYLGITDIQLLSKALNERRDKIIKFATIFIGNVDGSFNKGVSLFYLSYLLIAERESISESTNYVNKFWRNPSIHLVQGLVQRITDTYNKMKSSL